MDVVLNFPGIQAFLATAFGIVVMFGAIWGMVKFLQSQNMAKAANLGLATVIYALIFTLGMTGTILGIGAALGKWSIGG